MEPLVAWAASVAMAVTEEPSSAMAEPVDLAELAETVVMVATAPTVLTR